MSTGFALWKGNSRDLGWGELDLATDGRLTLQGSKGSAEVRLDPQSTPYVDVYVSDDWLCAVGGGGEELVVGQRSATPVLRVAGWLQRAQATDRFEFERHSLRFHDRPGHDHCLLAWELGVGLVDRATGLLWTYVHGDVNQRLVKITPATVELRGLYEAVTVDLAHGVATVDELRARPADDHGEVLAEWMRSIGH